MVILISHASSVDCALQYKSCETKFHMDVVDGRFRECSLLVPTRRIFHAYKPLRKRTKYFWPSNSCPLCVTNLREWPVTSQVSAAGGKMAEHLRVPWLEKENS